MTRERIEQALHEAERLFDVHVRSYGVPQEDVDATYVIVDVLREMLEEHNERD